ncbi:periplasmic sensor hybrid histidine kinase [Caenispirillum salinarum AK4]|uniref:histidine kinase n=1 Tax=Caenispirillum salinarum AK4 TaxID=1238182 RepID=K9H580_9PROT|nr:ATP-binding protein [Caenispirillum salinarum]EKV32707.1 periplasmic sensor hybrid histidine kinase [Caenispirillum salinarum AK4]
MPSVTIDDGLTRSILEMAPNGIYEIDVRGTILFSNPAHHRLLGYEPGSLVGRSILDLVPEADAARLRRDLDFLRREKPKPEPYLNRSFTRDGGEIMVEVHWTYKTAADGTVTGFIAILNDVTDRIEAEALREKARRAAEEAAAARSRFLATASHDLRQPLQALSLFVSRLERRGMEPAAREIVGDIRDSVGTLSSLLDSLLDMSRFDAGMTRTTIEAVPLAPLFRGIARDFAPVAERKGLRLRLRPPPEGLAVRSDARLLQRVVGNLVSNAITYTQTGGVLLCARRRGASVRVEVWDTGLGIDPDHLDRVFHEFYQIDGAAGDQGGGLGLGLAIVDRAARALGHAVDARSRPGRGSMFAITAPGVPVRAAAPGAALLAGADGQPAGEALLTPLNAAVAVVENDPAVRRALVTLLEEWRCRVVAAAGDGHSLLRALAEARGVPDVIVADLRLPGGMDGMEAVAAVRAELGESVPALIVTGDTDPTRLRGAAGQGVPILHKPVSVPDLHAALSQIIGG